MQQYFILIFATILFTILLWIFVLQQQNANAVLASCINYNLSTRFISISCHDSAVNPTDIYNALKNPTFLHKENSSSSKIWFLNANLVLENGAKLYINSSDTSWLKINSTNGLAYRIEVRDGNLIIDSVKITSWDTSKNDYARTNSNGSYPRSYIFVNGGTVGKVNITNSEIAYLGYGSTSSSFGLTYYTGAGSIIENNKIHHLWYGYYSTNKAHNIKIENNEFYNNSIYGIGPHSGAHDLVINNNKVFNNAKNGIICSAGCYHIVIESNKVFNNTDNGVVFYANVSNSIVRNNIIYNNGGDQISIYGSNNNELYGNTIINGKTGIRLSDQSAHNNIRDNNITNPSRYGIYVLNNAHNIEIYNDHIRGGEFGIRLANQSANNNIHDNTITNPSQYGIYILDGSSWNLVSSNIIKGSSSSALYIQDQNTNNNIFKNNSLLNNKQDAIRLYNLGKSVAIFVKNTIGATAGFEYSVTGSSLNLVDTEFSVNNIKSFPSPSFSKSTGKIQYGTNYNKNKVTITYSYNYVVEHLAKMTSPPLGGKSSEKTMLSELLFAFTNPLFLNLVQNQFLPSIEFIPPVSAPAVEYPNGPVIENGTNLKVETVFDGLKFPIAMAFLNQNDILVLAKNNGTVQRIVNGNILPAPILHVNVDNNGERGMLGIAVAKHKNATGITTTYVFLYFTESSTSTHCTHNIPTTTKTANNASPICNPQHYPLGNRLYRYELVGNKLVNPKLLLNVNATPGPIHNGGKIVIGPDDNIYIAIGDVGNHKTQAENFRNGPPPDGTGGILRISQSGQPILPPILGNTYPLNLYFAYGIRNSFGIDFDPVTGNLWDTENGPNYGDEINHVDPGFNSGWAQVQGIWAPKGEIGAENAGPIDLHASNLVTFGGKGTYRAPEFIWVTTVGPTAIKFLNSTKLGKQYQNDMFVGGFHTGSIYHFKLNTNRTGLYLKSPLADKIANYTEELRTGGAILASGFGGITDIEVGPYDGYLYVLALHKGGGDCDPEFPNRPCISFNSPLEGTIFRIMPKAH
ncbi:MAG: PQQ-dependent sugar dehydrogenase [Thermoproteota archaeon]|nr:PQQ-dependent sugar dehydrogenase [Thermoproteota archaeon]